MHKCKKHSCEKKSSCEKKYKAKCPPFVPNGVSGVTGPTGVTGPGGLTGPTGPAGGGAGADYVFAFSELTQTASTFGTPVVFTEVPVDNGWVVTGGTDFVVPADGTYLISYTADATVTPLGNNPATGTITFYVTADGTTIVGSPMSRRETYATSAPTQPLITVTAVSNTFLADLTAGQVLQLVMKTNTTGQIVAVNDTQVAQSPSATFTITKIA